MMDLEEFRKQGHELVDWMADYFKNIENYPVKSQVSPGDIYKQLPDSAPEEGESFPEIMNDFKEKILPGITHWQHPGFFAYFNANNSFPSILGEMLTATMGAQCMIWDTSPAAAELEEKTMNWLKEMLGLPSNLHGVIQDTASTASLVAILTAREKYSNYQVNQKGFSSEEHFTVYCSTETHSSVEKGVKIAGIGKENLTKISTDDNQAMNPEALEAAIKTDIANGKKPICVVAALGTTSTTAVDPLKEIAAICKKYNCWLHVDAAYAGSALILPEYRWMIEGIEDVDSFVFNPHKWLFVNFDCTAYYVKDKEALLRTFEILPEYLKTVSRGKVNDYRDWGVQLGRRFRALKLWFVLRNFGVKGLQQKLRSHMELAQSLESWINENEDFEILAPVNFNLVCFRYHPKHINDEETLTKLNTQLLNAINQTGNFFITHTKIKGKYAIRVVTGQTNIEPSHLENFCKLMINLIKKLN